MELGAEDWGGSEGAEAPYGPTGGTSSSSTGRWGLRTRSGCRVAVPSYWLGLLALKMAEPVLRLRQPPQPQAGFPGPLPLPVPPSGGGGRPCSVGR